jgi:hypothetical protein
MTKAKWRGLISITRARGLFTAEARHGEIDALMVGDESLDSIMGDRRRAFFKATVLGDGTLLIGPEVGRKRYYSTKL